MFENYIVDSNYATIEDAEKRAVLLANITPKGYDIFTTQNSGTTYAEAIKALETDCSERFSKTYAVYNFRKLRQETGQDVSTFAGTLISAAQQCDFGGQVDAEVKQQLISGIREPRICQELLFMADTETLENVLKRAKQMETSVCEQGGMSQVGSTDSGAFALNRNKTTPRTQKTGPASSTFICKYCGRSQKHRSKEDCTSWGKKCKKCDQPNHFAAVCKSSTSKVGYSNMRGTSQGAKTHVAWVVADEVACLESLVGFASTQAGAPKLLDGTTDGKKERWLVDSGSPSTLLSLKCAQELGLQWLQVTGSDTLKSATGSKLVEVGRVNCSLSISGHSFTVPVRVIENLSFGAILGRDSLSNFSQVTLKTSDSGRHLVLAAHTEKAGVAEILKECKDVFDKSLKDSKLNIEPEPTNDLTDDAVPIRSPSRSYSPEDREVIRKTVKSLLENGIVEESRSQWRSQSVIVSKPGGGKRMTVDYSCTVNKFGKLDAFPLPLISDLIQKVGKYKYFSVVDITQAYHQVPLVKEEMEKTAFEALGKLLQYTRLCFGVGNAVLKFQWTMVLCFDDIPGVFIYLDDIVICGNTIQEHNANLRAFLQRCRELNVSLNSKKCSFGQSELNWLGYVISEGTFKPDCERTKSLKEYKEPTNMKELERFLGKANYYSKFVSRFAELASTLQYLKNSGQFQWSSRLADTFRAVKAAILESFLTVPDFNQEFVLETDASGIAMAGVLTQHGCPVAVASSVYQPPSSRGLQLSLKL